LSKSEIKFELRKALKTQVLTHFIAEMTLPFEDEKTTLRTIFINVSSNSKGSDAWFIIKNKNDLIIELSIGLYHL